MIKSPSVFGTPQSGATLHVKELRLAALPGSVRLARRHVSATLREWGLDALDFESTQVVSEMATNSVAETGPAQAPEGYVALYDRTPPMLAVRVRLTGTHLVVEVSDLSPNPPRPRQAADNEENGRGMAVIESLSAGWGWYPSDTGGKVVWACWQLNGLAASREVTR